MQDPTRLLRAACLGSPGAAEALVRACYDDVWRLCRALVDEPSADDLAQETFARAFRALRRFRGDATARTWILATARHTCMDELRARTRRRRRDAALQVEPQDVAPDPAGNVGVHELLQHLDADRRAAFALTQILRLSYADAAIVCDCPRGTIRSRVARARDDLITLLEAPAAAGPNRRHADR